MANSKTYLNVPYAEKDAVKAIGGKWDATNKKWFIPANTDITPFAKWQTDLSTLKSSPSVNSGSTKAKSHDNKYTRGVITHPKDKNFVAYSGDQPPWD